jgi:CDP-2,3-bis-(O-geranylgeranyl)-sn-glycerol synthase
MEEVLVALNGLWLMLPALLPNSAAVIFGGGTPVDFGRSLGGRRILGDGKTWCGFIGGCTAGLALGIILMMIAFPFDPEGLWGFGGYPGLLGVVLALSLGSLLGDMGGSFIKRRLAVKRGARMPVLDQYDFLLGAIILVTIFYPDWFMSNFWEGDGWIALVTLLLAVPILHRAVNIIGYKMGKKEVPW